MPNCKIVLRPLGKLALPLLLAFVLCGCELPETDPPAPKSTPRPFNGIVDGTWDYGDVALNTPYKSGPYATYKITVTAPPTLTTTDGGKTIKITSPLTFERRAPDGKFEDKGASIPETEHISFMPGKVDEDSSHYMNESYGTQTTLKCKGFPKSIGDQTACSVSFEAPQSEIKNSSWDINKTFYAAWPGQKP